MSKFFKNIMRKEKENRVDDITNYLIAEIEDIVSKKVGNYNTNDSSNEKSKSNHKYNDFNRNNSFPSNNYSSHINYNLQKEQPFKASKYINEDTSSRFLPFEETEIKPKIHNEDQIKSIVKKTLRPALDQWLDDNLEIIIERAIKRNFDRYMPKKKKRTIYYDN